VKEKATWRGVHQDPESSSPLSWVGHQVL
jgi:hypothetical protein